MSTPDNPTFVAFCHPKNKQMFLFLPRNNVLPGTLATFSVYHETALTACFIIACNELGFLSTSANKSDVNAQVSLEHHQFLTAAKYYYHLATQPPDPNYRICTEFAYWCFPHNKLPQSWAQEAPIINRRFQWGSNWTAISNRIKERDQRCRVTGWIDNQKTAHIVLADDREWMRTNEMSIYAVVPNPEYVDQDPKNLFSLRWDLHFSQFDSGNFVIAPMGGGMVTHFIASSHESANLYHNQPFNTSNLSHEFLYARFAWAIIKKARSTYTSHSARIRKTFSLEIGIAEEVDGGDGGGPSNPQQQFGDIKGKGKGTKRRRSGRSSGSKAPAVPEALELAKDIAKAAKVAPFFLEPEGIANPYAYENMVWYPGYEIVQRRKLEYMNAHPNIRATSGLCASLDTDSEGTIY